MNCFDWSAHVHRRKRLFTARAVSCAAVAAAICLAIGFLPDDADARPQPSRDATMDSAPTVRLPGHVLPALHKATRLSPGAAAAHKIEPLNVTIVLKRDHQANFERYRRGLLTPSHRFTAAS
jgi:hypothetical protein